MGTCIRVGVKVSSVFDALGETGIRVFYMYVYAFDAPVGIGIRVFKIYAFEAPAGTGIRVLKYMLRLQWEQVSESQNI